MIEQQLDDITTLMKKMVGLMEKQDHQNKETSKECMVASTEDGEKGLKGIVSSVEHDGKMYVRVHVGKYDFCIDLKAADKEMNWDDAMKYAKDKGMRLFTLEEGLLMFCFKDEINAMLKNIGGDELTEDDAYWSSTEYGRNSARYVNFSNGSANTYSKYIGNVVRPVAAFNIAP